jgi:hypothetical protein
MITDRSGSTETGRLDFPKYEPGLKVVSKRDVENDQGRQLVKTKPKSYA